ncbi:MAG TPA: sialidase family protein [bacterium]|nr:sialidase family protein [bacterium]
MTHRTSHMPLRGLLAALGALVFGFGCSQGPQFLAPPDPAALPQGPPASTIEAGGVTVGEGALGAFRFTLDPTQLQATLEPYGRSAMGFGDSYAVDASGFLAGSPCGDCFKVDGVGLSPTGQLFVDFQTRHPFKLPTLPTPLDGERYDLHLFDVRGLFLFRPPTGASTQGFVQLAHAGGPDPRGPQSLSIDNSGFLAGISRDGLTGAYDAYTDGFWPTDATLHPYAMLREDTGPSTFRRDVNNGTSDIRVPTGHNVLPMGGGPYTRRVYFNAPLGGEPIEYLVLVLAQFGASSQGRGSALGQRLNPVYFVPEYNLKAPWKVQVEEQTNELRGGDPTSTARVQVKIWDWQHALGLDTLVGSLTPTLATPRDSLLAPSRVTAVRAQVAGLADPGDIAGNYAGGNGSPGSPLLWNLTIPNASAAAEGSYLGLVQVLDEHTGNPAIPGGIGRDGRTPFMLGRPATYIPFTVMVAPAGTDPNTGFHDGASMFNPTDPLPDVSYTRDTYGAFAAQSVSGAHPVYAAVQAEQTPVTGQDVLVIHSNSWASAWSQPLLPYTAVLGHQEHPALAVAPNGVSIYLVYSGPGGQGKPDIYCHASQTMGLSWGPAVRVNSLDNKIQGYPSVAVTPAGRVVVAWEHDGRSKVGFAYSDTAGTLFLTQGAYSSERPVRQPQVVAIPEAKAENGFAIAYWQDPKDGTADSHVLVYPSGSSGSAARFPVYNEPEGIMAVRPSAAFKPDGTLLVAFTEGTTAANERIRIARKPWGASSFSLPVTLAAHAGAVHEHPTVIVRSNGGALVAWNDNSDPLTGHDIYLAESPDGGLSWGAPRREVGLEGPQQWPNLVLDPEIDRALLFWYDSAKSETALALQCAAEPLP